MQSEAEGMAPPQPSLDALVARIRERGGPCVAVGAGSPLLPILHELVRLGGTEAPAVFWGEPGVGRRTLARVLHALSRRSEAPIVSARRWTKRHALGGQPAGGARTGPLFGAESPPDGTLLLEDLEGLPPATQDEVVALLDAQHAGGSVEGAPDSPRILAVAHEHPGTLVEDGDLSEELFHRLSMFVIEVPPLRRRPGDVVAISEHVVRRANELHRLSVRGFEPETLDVLRSSPWPGNVPELRRVVEHAAIRAERGFVEPRHLPGRTEGPNPTSPPAHLVLPLGITAADAERRLVLATLERTGFNKSEAARQLGIDVKTIRNKLKLYGLSERRRGRRGRSAGSDPGHR